MIEIDGLTKSFGPLMAVSGIDLKVGRGEVLGFLGPNGAGKSTTMKMVTGYPRAHVWPRARMRTSTSRPTRSPRSG